MWYQKMSHMVSKIEPSGISHFLTYAGKIIPMSQKSAHFYMNLQNATQKMPQAFFATDQATGNRQQATGNRQQATGNRQQATGNRQQATGNILYSSSKESCQLSDSQISQLYQFSSFPRKNAF